VPGPTNRATARALTAWAALAEVERLSEFQVVVRPQSALGPPGWVGILRLAGTVTVAVPDAGLVDLVGHALRGLPAVSMTSEDVTGRLPGVVEVKGPAALFFAVESPVPARHFEVVQASVDELDGLLASVPVDELDESGISEVTSSVSVIRDSHGAVVAACGYRHWPHGIAHMCVLTQPEHRGRGAARAVGATAVSRALDEGLLPQWRARPGASKAVARALGLLELGEQLSVRVEDREAAG